tara:strand:- start:344 stop:574 length:231 start_codon:yes stop_codon:yes gene_type:complete
VSEKAIEIEAVKTRFIPVTKWNDYHSWPPQGGLRHLIFNAKENGFDAVIRRKGRRVLIDEQAFFKWMNDNNEGVQP